MAGFSALVVHWDGRSWEQIPNYPDSHRRAIDAVTAREVWSLGGHMDSYDYVFRWDGTRERVSYQTDSSLNDVAAAAHYPFCRPSALAYEAPAA